MKKETKRIIAASLAAVLCAGMLTACGGSSSGGSAAPAATTAAAAASGETVSASQAAAEAQAKVDNKISTTAKYPEAPEAPEPGTSITSAKKNLIVATSSDAHTMNPHQVGSRQFLRIGNCIYEMLVYTHADGSIDPWIAKDWDYTDDSITFHLNEGINFQDGTPCNAEAVVWNMAKWGESDAVTTATKYVDWANAKAVDEYTVTVPVDGYHYELLAYMGSVNYMLISPTAYEADPDGYALKPVGTGPYKLTEYVLDDHVKLERWDGYWGGRDVYLDEILFRYIPESSQQLIELETGGVDVICDVPFISWDTIEGNDELKLTVFPTCTIDFIWFNCIDENLFSNKLIRQACAYAINLKEIWEAAYYGLSTPAFSYCPTTNYGYDPSYEFENWPYEWDQSDEAKCRELLAEAGYPDGLTGITLEIDTDANRTRVAEIVANQLTKCGIETHVESYEYATSQSDQYGAKFQIALNGAQTNGHASKNMSERFLSALAYPGSFSMSKWNEPKIDELLSTIAGSQDDAERLECYKEISDLYTEQVPAIAYWNRIQCVASVKNLMNVQSYFDPYNFTYAYFE